MTAANGRSRTRARRGSTYILILGVSVILMVIGLSAATVARVNTRSVAVDNDWAEAQVLAFSAAEHALAAIQATDDWRTKFRSSETTVNLARGTFRWRLVDEADGDLADNDAEPFLIVARGQVNDGAYAVGLNCVVDGEPLEALKCALHADHDVHLWAFRTLTATNGPVSTTSKLRTDHKSVLSGDVEAKSVTGSGRITGTVTAPAPPKAMPSKGVFDMYRQMATRIDPGYWIARKVLAPELNPWGAPNPRGIYYIDAPGKSVTITNSRIYGTLVVRCRQLFLAGNVLLHNSRGDQPALIVDGDLVTLNFSGTTHLREGSANPNFNPRGAPYKGAVDADTSDTYPSEIQGLVHVRKEMWLGGTTRVRGVILCEGKAQCYGINEIIHDSDIYERPPLGYSSGAGRVIPQGWKRIID
ncbi:MAG: hypothetical protein WBF17_14810 [Phycisphaerae bacterium]